MSVIVCEVFVSVCGMFVSVCGMSVIVCEVFVSVCGMFVIVCEHFVSVCECLSLFVSVCLKVKHTHKSTVNYWFDSEERSPLDRLKGVCDKHLTNTLFVSVCHCLWSVCHCL